MERYLRDVSIFLNSEDVLLRKTISMGSYFTRINPDTLPKSEPEESDKASLVGSYAKTWKGRMGSPSWTL